MLLSLVLVCGALYGLAWIWLAWESEHAPYGWEDEDGWHEDEQS